MIHANMPFRAVEDFYFLAFCNEIRPSYEVPSRYVLSHDLLDSEAARVNLAETERLAGMKRITFLIDGWEDIGRRSLYGTVAAGINQFPVVLGLKDMTGQRGSAEKMLEAAEEAIRNAQLPIEDMIATCTDNPTVMQSF